ncbi:hypothetical protein FB451DRAFT_1307459 [Mycena latifolia]|nr:hypothetical protein FB451DRAFT_1307459 [Mycena latifolia]
MSLQAPPFVPVHDVMRRRCWGSRLCACPPLPFLFPFTSAVPRPRLDPAFRAMQPLWMSRKLACFLISAPSLLAFPFASFVPDSICLRRETLFARSRENACPSSRSSPAPSRAFLFAPSSPFPLLAALPLLALMLAVMTFQAAFIFALMLDLGVGEALFGRYAAAAGVH